MDMSFEEDHHSAHNRGPGLKWKQRQNQNHQSKVWHCSSTRDFFFGNHDHSWCLYSHSGQLLRCPKVSSVLCRGTMHRKFAPYLFLLLKEDEWVTGPDLPHQVDPPCPPVLYWLLATHSCYLRRVALGHMEAVSIRRLCIHIPPPTRGWWLTRSRR